MKMPFLRKIRAHGFLTLLIIMQPFVLLSGCTAFYHGDTKRENQSLETRLDSKVPGLLNKYNVPGAAMAIIRNGEIVYSKAWGVQRAGEASQIDEQTLFEAASLTKPVFAYGVFKLVRDKKIDLDKPLSEYLQEPYIKEDERIHKITSRMVLSHTSGLPNWRPEFLIETDTGIEYSKSPGPLKIQFDPGTWFRYSAEGYNYLQHVVENITEQRLDIYMRDAVLDPLGMNASIFIWEETKELSVAMPHNEEGQAVNEWLWRFQKPMAAGTLFTTVTDYARFLSAMLSTKESLHSGSLQNLSAHDLEKMLQPQIEIGNQLAWSLGWGLEKHEREWFFWQWGDNPGFKHFAVGSRSQKLAVVVFTNGQNGKNVYRPIIGAILGVKLNALDETD
jgi:CubicO group peptidase (beta-lactamase class C family)